MTPKRKDTAILTKSQAKKMIHVQPNGMVHTFYNMSFGLIGGDHSEESVLKDIDNAFMCKKTGKQANDMGHGLVIIPSEKCFQKDLLFVETKKPNKKVQK